MGDFLTPEEQEGVDSVRRLIGDKIPSKQDTDFHLRRWWKSYNGNLEVGFKEQIKKV